MQRQQNPNLEILEAAVAQLGPLADQMVFLGGCATALLLTDVAAPPIRATRDVDVVTEVASIGEYYRLADRLRERGFREDQTADAPVCRWVAGAIVLDVMPTKADILGFGNDWYQPALDTAIESALPSGRRIYIVTAPYFLATKLAAFDGRGAGDYVMSHDMEDVVAVLDGRPEVVDEIKESEESLRRHLEARFAALQRDPEFVAALPGHLPGDVASEALLEKPMMEDRAGQSFARSRAAVLEALAASMQAQRIAAMVYPTMPFNAPSAEDDWPDIRTPLRYGNWLGLLEVSVPAGYGADGLPALNVSIVGLPGEDAQVLAWTHAFEREGPQFEAPARPV